MVAWAGEMHHKQPEGCEDTKNTKFQNIRVKGGRNMDWDLIDKIKLALAVVTIAAPAVVEWALTIWRGKDGR